MGPSQCYVSVPGLVPRLVQLARRGVPAQGGLLPTILHISDLHRTSAPRLNNDELLAAIFSDATRWEAEGIPWPDLIVLSGDVIQGVRADTQEPDLAIAEQYAEATDFLEKLTAKFVDSDRSRIIIVPGN